MYLSRSKFHHVFSRKGAKTQGSVPNLLAFFAEIKYNIFMIQKIRGFWLFFGALMLFTAVFSYSQETAQEQFARRFQNGTQFYRLSRFNEAAAEFRRAQEISANAQDKARSLYWVILSQMAYSDFGSAIVDIEELERIAPNSNFARDMLYHRARVYYIQGFFEEALYYFNQYIGITGDTDRESSDRRAAAFFWMGECLYAMGQFDEADRFYGWVIGRYPDSPKWEAAAYRIDLIKHKKIEAQLLALLQWSHEESLRTSAEHQRTIRTYEHTLNLYQRRIAELVSPGNSINSENRLEPEFLNPESVNGNSLMERARRLDYNIDEILRERASGGN